MRGEGRLRGTLASIALHGLVLFLALFPFVLSEHSFAPIAEGAGGPGPAGGGGGGSRGTGGVKRTVEERVRYVQIAPEPAPTPVPEPIVPPITPPPVPPPVPPPEPVVTPPPVPEPPSVAVAVPAISQVAGTGGGSGNDGSAGAGPGSGGGVGSGIGTGRGGGIGPGTGGGSGTIYPPVATQLVLIPLNAPVKPYHMIATFDIDATGRVLAYSFNETRDGRYNREVRRVLGDIRFRPATTADGVPVRASYTMEFTVW